MTDDSYISLYQLTRKIESALKDPDLSFKWVTFEIKSLNIQQSNGHCYLELIEKSPNGTTIASARGTIWCSTFVKISGKFFQATGMQLQKGMKVLALVSVSFHSLYGLSINITDIDPTFTLGESERIRRETIEKLHADGVWDLNRMNPIPDIIQRVAVISSPTAAGYGDFCRQIEESGFKFSITLFESLMQGMQAEQSIMNSLEQINRHIEEYDAIVIIRGGGASGDLDCFDGYMVCSAIANMPLPVITGIGHDRDVSIADMVAAVPLKTPTAVAASLIEKISSYLSKLEDTVNEINHRVQNIILGLWNNYEISCSLLRHNTEAILASKSLQLSEYRNGLSRITSNVSVREQSRVSREEAILRQATVKFLSQKSSSLKLYEQSLTMRWNIGRDRIINDLVSKGQRLQSVSTTRYERFKATTERMTSDLRNSIILRNEKEQMKINVMKDKIRLCTETILKNQNERNYALEQLLISHNPRNVLQRGYALIRKGEKIVPSSKDLHIGENLDIVLRDGIINTEIKKINH